MQRKHNPKITPLAKNLRKNMTKEERKLWYDFLRSYPVKFLRQKILGDYIVDFYCAEAGLVVEIDGSQHFEEKGLDYDEKRTAFLQGYGLLVVRIPNNELNLYFDRVCEYLDLVVKERLQDKA